MNTSPASAELMQSSPLKAVRVNDRLKSQTTHAAPSPNLRGWVARVLYTEGLSRPIWLPPQKPSPSSRELWTRCTAPSLVCPDRGGIRPRPALPQAQDPTHNSRRELKFPQAPIHCSCAQYNPSVTERKRIFDTLRPNHCSAPPRGRPPCGQTRTDAENTDCLPIARW